MTEMLAPGVWPCKHCESPVVIRQLRGRRWPFDRALQRADDVPEELRFVPVRAGHGVIMLPSRDMAPRRLEGIVWFAQRHTCAEWLRWYRDQRQRQLDAAADRHHDLHETLAQIFGLADDTEEAEVAG
jgi:hypothetical protein